MRRALLLLLLAAVALAAHAGLRGSVALEERAFPQAAPFAGQHTHYPSLVLDPEWLTDLAGGDWTLTVEPFARLAPHDPARQHADLRQLLLYHAHGDWEWRLGVGRVFWGVTESQHLVDVINQTDFVEDLDGEDKLGQPMLNLTWTRDWGVLDLFVLPGFRERSFPGREGRLRGPLPVDTDHPRYESARRDRHVDWALRWSHSRDVWDVGAYVFRGTARDPQLRPTRRDGVPRLVPYYEIVTQFGIDAQATLDAWLWKLEWITRLDAEPGYSAAVGGFEYTFVDLAGRGLDLGTLLEYHRDTRGAQAPTPFQNDLFAGLRLTFNDAQSSELLAGVFLDLDQHSTTARIEASRRLGQRWKLTGTVQLFGHIDPRDPQYPLRRDDYLEVGLARYF